MKKIKIIGVFAVFLLSFISHFMYDIWPNGFFSFLFPVNESVFEHMKLILTPTLMFALFEYWLYKRKGIDFNNFILSYGISVILGIMIYLILYWPIHVIFSHNFLIAILVLLFTFGLVQWISYRVMNIRGIRYGNIFGWLLILVLYVVFGYLTYFPPESELFYDMVTGSYGINDGDK